MITMIFYTEQFKGLSDSFSVFALSIYESFKNGNLSSRIYSFLDETPENCEDFLNNDGMTYFVECLKVIRSFVFDNNLFHRHIFVMPKKSLSCSLVCWSGRHYTRFFILILAGFLHAWS